MTVAVKLCAGRIRTYGRLVLPSLCQEWMLTTPLIFLAHSVKRFEHSFNFVTARSICNCIEVVALQFNGVLRSFFLLSGVGYIRR
jgi:hypothetical protein